MPNPRLDYREPPPGPPPIFQNCFRMRLQPGWNSGPHQHNFHELYCVEQGVFVANTGGEAVPCGTGSLWVYPARQDHFSTVRCTAARPVAVTVIRWFGEAPPEDIALPAPDTQGRVAAQIAWAIEQAAPVDGLEDGLGPPEVRAFLNAILRTILFEFQRNTTGKPLDIVARTRTLVQNALNRRLHLDLLARNMNMSVFHFARRFRAAAGCTPMEFVQQERVRAAETLLRNTTLTLEAIADNAGFSDASHMHQVFRRLRGKAPGHYRPATARSRRPVAT